MWPAPRPKEEGLPITQNGYGFVQQSSWRQTDRLDEEVVEIDSPYSVMVAAGACCVGCLTTYLGVEWSGVEWCRMGLR